MLPACLIFSDGAPAPVAHTHAKGRENLPRFKKQPALSISIVNPPRHVFSPAIFSGTPNEQGALDVVNMRDAALGWTPLHWASVTNRLDFMFLLLDAGACVDARDLAGRTPLYACAAFGAVDAAAVLLQGGAAVDGPDFRGVYV